LKKALKKPINVKKLKEKAIRKKEESWIVQLGRIGLNSVRVSVCQAVWIDREDARA